MARKRDRQKQYGGDGGRGELLKETQTTNGTVFLKNTHNHKASKVTEGGMSKGKADWTWALGDFWGVWDRSQTAEGTHEPRESHQHLKEVLC